MFCNSMSYITNQTSKGYTGLIMNIATTINAKATRTAHARVWQRRDVTADPAFRASGGWWLIGATAATWLFVALAGGMAGLVVGIGGLIGTVAYVCIPMIRSLSRYAVRQTEKIARRRTYRASWLPYIAERPAALPSIPSPPHVPSSRHPDRLTCRARRLCGHRKSRGRGC